MRHCRTWWALPGRLGSANGRDAFYCFARPTGSRSKTEFFGFAGRRARTAPAGGLLFPDFQVHGSRSKTEFIDFAGRRARTVPAPGPRSDEKRCTEGPGVRASLPTIIFSKRKELTTNSHSRLVVVNSNHPFLPPALIRILCHQKLTTGLRFPAGCRQSNVFFAENAPIKIKVRNKITFFHSDFLLPGPPTALSLGHLALIHPATAWKLTTQPRGRGFRRQFPPLLRDRSKLEVFHEYLYGGYQQRFRSNGYS